MPYEGSESNICAKIVDNRGLRCPVCGKLTDLLYEVNSYKSGKRARLFVCSYECAERKLYGDDYGKK